MTDFPWKLISNQAATGPREDITLGTKPEFLISYLLTSTNCPCPATYRLGFSALKPRERPQASCSTITSGSSFIKNGPAVLVFLSPILLVTRVNRSFLPDQCSDQWK